MALTKEQWFEKLKGFVPTWVFEDEKFNVAIFKGIVRILNEAQVVADDHLKQTFIDSSETIYLNQHGDERNIERRKGETNSAYAARVKQIRNGSNCPDLKTLTDSYLIVGESQIIENADQTNFFNRNGFLNRNLVNFNVTYNAYTIIVDKQVPSRDTFFSREEFYNRESFIGSNESLLELFEAIVNALNRNKGFGISYRLFERLGA